MVDEKFGTICLALLVQCYSKQLSSVFSKNNIVLSDFIALCISGLQRQFSQKRQLVYPNLYAFLFSLIFVMSMTPDCIVSWVSRNQTGCTKYEHADENEIWKLRQKGRFYTSKFWSVKQSYCRTS